MKVIKAFLIVVLGIVMLVSTASAERLDHRFSPGSFGDPAWERRFNAESPEHRLDPAGWIVNYPAQPDDPKDESKQTRSGGFRSVFRVADDFEATLRFRLGTVDKPQGPAQPGVFLRVTFVDESDSLAVGTVRRNDGTWRVQGRLLQSGRAIENFQVKATDTVAGLVLERSGKQFRAFWLDRRNQPIAAFDRTIDDAFSKHGQLNLWVTDGSGGGRVDVTMQSIEVEAANITVGQGSTAFPPSPWRWMALVSTVTVLIGGVIRWRMRS